MPKVNPKDVVVLHIDRAGTIRSFHTDAFPMEKLGKMKVERLSHVEFSTRTQKWVVWNASKKKRLFTHKSRQKCLDWEEKHFKHDLMRYLPTKGKKALPKTRKKPKTK